MFELLLRAGEALVEPVSDLLMDTCGALSVSVEDADAGTDSERALFGEPGMPEPAAGWQHSSLRALFETQAAAETAVASLLAQYAAAGLSVQAVQALAEEDWVRITQSQFTPVNITPQFWVVPSWHQPPAAATHVIRLDPGLAFGTGTHPTTRMCLHWLATHASAFEGARALDYGCGSGILAIGAALFGAASVDAVDIDPAAVQATRENTASNSLGRAALSVHAGLPELAQGRYGLVLANILASPLKLLAPLLCAHLAPGAWLIMAGILNRQAAELQNAYAPWLNLQVLAEEEGWILMGAQRPTAGT